MCGVLALLFLVVPATEIYLIIEVGGFLGTMPTLAIIAVTAVLGAALAKSQGLAVLRQLQQAMASGQGTGLTIVEGCLVLVAGVTLLAPGFLTDSIGLALLVPPVRRAIAKHLAGKVNVVSPMGMGGVSSEFYQGSDDDDLPPPGVIDV